MGKIAHRLKNRGKASDSATTEVVAIAEAARKDDGIDSAQVALFMPEKAGWELKASFQSPSHIAITIGARENDDPDGHA
jgi:hypothetical protein